MAQAIYRKTLQVRRIQISQNIITKKIAEKHSIKASVKWLGYKT